MTKSHLLSPERTALRKPRLASSRLAKNSCATLADDDGLCVGEDGRNSKAAGAFYVHEKGPRGGNEHLRRVSVCLLVLEER